MSHVCLVGYQSFEVVSRSSDRKRVAHSNCFPRSEGVHQSSSDRIGSAGSVLAVHIQSQSMEAANAVVAPAVIAK